MGFNPHTHAGCDLWPFCRNLHRQSFNPHTHAGCDLHLCPFFPLQKVSIHTPTQGVTIKIRYSCIPKRFQSTHPRRVWHVPHLTLSFLSCFNPHTHAGCDCGRVTCFMIDDCFNPHTHAGCDFIVMSFRRSRVFQSTHPRRVWLSWFLSKSTVMEFQSTHPRRVWQINN